MDILDYILRKQQKLKPDPAMRRGLAPHAPEMLLIGCVDARLDIIDDIGIPKGKALVMRNIAALVVGAHEESPVRPVESAILEFAVEVMKVKHIAVMGHTDCGGIRAQLEGLDMPNIRLYLDPLSTVHKQVVEQGGGKQAQARRMEQEAVRLSLRNLRTYPAVTSAERKGDLKLHGWVIDTATQLLYVLDEKEGTFAPMTENS